MSDNSALETSTMTVSEIDSRSKDIAIQRPLRKVSDPEVSVVIPCLNEADTLEACIKTAQWALGEHCISGEIIVADNGSTDGSQAIAMRMGVRLVHVEAKGYGNALMGGGSPRVGALCSPARCHFCTGGGGIRCSPVCRGECSIRQFMMCVVAFA